jgi:predicted metalloprotease with PDZ domain
MTRWIASAALALSLSACSNAPAPQDESKMAAPSPAVHRSVAFLGASYASAVDGVKIAKIDKESPAMKAGLVKNDVVLSINGTHVSKKQDMKALIAAVGPGGLATIQYKRGGELRNASITLGARQDQDGEKEKAGKKKKHEADDDDVEEENQNGHDDGDEDGGMEDEDDD